MQSFEEPPPGLAPDKMPGRADVFVPQPVPLAEDSHGQVTETVSSKARHGQVHAVDGHSLRDAAIQSVYAVSTPHCARHVRSTEDDAADMQTMPLTGTGAASGR